MTVSCEIASDEPIYPDDLEFEFERTGFSKGTFAEMLRINATLVTRLLNGKRYWQPGEAMTARALFALVPVGIDPGFRTAIFRMGSSLRHDVAERALLSAPDHAVGPSRLGKQRLRSDEIVHICRMERLDLELLVESGQLADETDPQRLSAFDRSIDELYARAATGEFLEKTASRSRHGGRRPAAARATIAPEILAPSSTSLRPGLPVDCKALSSCSPLVVVDDLLEPRYRRGETLLVDSAERAPRHGDDVVIDLVDGKFEVGRLSVVGRDEVVLKDAGRADVSISRRSILLLRRIVCVVR